MTTRFQDALDIQKGACNPRGITRTLIKHMDELSVGQGADAITSDPACRLIVHQLASLFNVWAIDNKPGVYGQLTKACEEDAALARLAKERP